MVRFLQSCVYSLDVMIYFRAKYDNERLRKFVSILLIPLGLIRYVWMSIKAKKLKITKKVCNCYDCKK